jgi:hypothetical protein
VVRNVTRDRRQAGEPEPDTLQQYMEGAASSGGADRARDNGMGGEQLGFEFSDESRLLVRAILPKAGLRWPHGQPLTADYFFSFFKSPHAKAFIVTP